MSKKKVIWLNTSMHAFKKNVDNLYVFAFLPL